MVETLIVLVGVAVGAALVAFLLWRLATRRRRDRVWRALADRHGLTFAASERRHSGKAVWISLEGSLDAVQCGVALEFAEKMGLSAVARFKIRPPLQAVGERPDPAQGVTGDMAFDKRFVMAADNAVLEALTEEVRDDLLEATEGLDAVGAISAKAVSLRIVSGLDDPEALDRLIDAGRAVARIVGETRGPSS